ncbi:major intrinsic protein, Aquaporin-like protein [Artemisia annua]|uniref:Major intrinsic protein, Aquaporin-like protein n=1 Tax=Artemisia annua TaxID=35608 RepID=A0A2U1MIL8_ARTAN|nr:major intrinsic protein, Aquaporin-like protein [Artemisia annua]
MKASINEFTSTLFFVFVGFSSAIAYEKLTADATLDPPGIVVLAICHAFALFVAVSLATNISGGYVKPGVVFALLDQCLRNIDKVLTLMSLNLNVTWLDDIFNKWEEHPSTLPNPLLVYQPKSDCLCRHSYTLRSCGYTPSLQNVKSQIKPHNLEIYISHFECNYLP